MPELLDGDRALVTGAGHGIGRGIAEELAAHGCDVAVNDVEAESARETAAALRSEHDVRATTCVGDVSAVADADGMVEAAVEALDGLDVLVNNAGIAVPQDFEAVHEDPETWERTLAVNLTGVKNCTAAAFPELKGGGRIVNVASTAGLRISPIMGAHYTSSKWGVIGFTKHVAHECGEFGIRANAICPGPTETPLTAGATEEQRAEIRADIPLGRWGRPEDVARVAVFFASELSGHVTGTALPVDGGFIVDA